MNNFSLVRERNIANTASDIAFAAIQENFVVGDLRGNFELIVNAAKEIIDEFVKIPTKNSLVIVTSELAISGYPPADLLMNDDFVRECGDMADYTFGRIHLYFIRQISENKISQDKELYFIIGTPTFSHSARTGQNSGEKRLYNTAVLYNNSNRREFYKTLLPTYNVFDEARYFEPCKDTSKNIFYVNGLPIGVTICEDIWNEGVNGLEQIYSNRPVEELKRNGAKFIINLSASPYFVGKREIRYNMIQQICSTYSIGMLYVNQVGGNDSLVFDGGTQISYGGNENFTYKMNHTERCAGIMGLITTNANGDIIGVSVVNDRHQVNREKNGFILPDGTFVRVPEQWENSRQLEMAQVISMGIRDYMMKTASLTKAVIGMSGGVDSALVTCLAVMALGNENVLGITMPTKFNTEGTKSDARLQAEMLGIDFKEIPIQDLFEQFSGIILDGKDNLNFVSSGENLQARIRGMILMGFSNETNRSIVLSTSNKSEAAMGYTTLFGDSAGGLAPISDVYKTDIFLISQMFADMGMLPQSVIERKPSAELAHDQFDEKSLGDYASLDKALYILLDKDGNFTEDEMDNLVNSTSISYVRFYEIREQVARFEYKRKSCPPTIAMSGRPWSIGWRRINVSKFEAAQLARVRGN
jgi:NAD+ synthase (glutamine-hydrolysing)